MRHPPGVGDGAGSVAWISTTAVKGLAMRSHESGEIGEGGLRGDRRFHLIDETGRLVNNKRLGSLMLEAVLALDIYLVMGSVLIGSLMLLFGNLLAISDGQLATFAVVTAVEIRIEPVPSSASRLPRKRRERRTPREPGVLGICRRYRR